MFSKIYRGVQNGILILTTIILAVMITVIFVQVITRYVFFYSLPWSEELSRYLFVWMIFLGVNLAVRDDLQIRIDVLDHYVHGRGKKALRIFQHVCSFAIAMILIYSSFKMVENGFRQTSPAMQIPMAFVYLGIPVGTAFTCIEFLCKIVGIIRGEEGEV